MNSPSNITKVVFAYIAGLKRPTPGPAYIYNYSFVVLATEFIRCKSEKLIPSIFINYTIIHGLLIG